MSDTTERYTSDAIDVTYDSRRCIHVAECVRGLPVVFDTHKRPWIQPGNASADMVATVIERCPTGALHFVRKDGGADEATPTQNTVQMCANGPYYVRGDVHIITPEGAVIVEDVRMALCRCGQSQYKPFCDNAHLKSGFLHDGQVEANDTTLDSEGGELVITARTNGPLKLQGNYTMVSADGTRTHRGNATALCRCGGSHTKPFCDGTHKTIGFPSLNAPMMVKVAVVQAASVLFDRDASVAKACNLTRKAAAQGAQLVLFPEAFIPAYPRGFSFGMVVGSRKPDGRHLWQIYWENAIDVPGPAAEQLGQAANENGVYLAIGVIERDSTSSRGTLYCTLLTFGPDGRLLSKHRKLKPTAAERLIWGEGNGKTLQVVETPLGRIGGLICWENYMPLARMALYSKGVELYLAPTADSRDTWQATLRHIACEGRCFVLGCNQFVTKAMVPADLPGIAELAQQPEIMCRGGSVIVSPLGEIIAGPLFDQEGILFADLDMGEIVRGKLDFDVAGHYARPDVFQFAVNGE